ncbi:MAG TPA: GerMN domain-containing protein [Bacillota bacterium]|nr:GerMN domain-containing protein [Bacillota bacterium]
MARSISVALLDCGFRVPAEDDTAFPGDTVDGEAIDNPGEEPMGEDNGTDTEEALEKVEETQAPPQTGQSSGQGGTEAPGTLKLTLYFSDLEAIETGATGQTGYVKAVTRELPYTWAVLRLALQELIKGPQPGEGALGRTLPAETRILGLTIDQGVAVINFSSDLLTAAGSPGGSLGGTVFRESIVYTATQFSTVDAVLVQVDGEPYSDGHYFWDKPVGRYDL